MASFYDNYKCNLCPNSCGVSRAEGFLGKCGVDDGVYVAHFGLHKWEEPVISGGKGSGTVFFSGCTMRCVFCQNNQISRKINGTKYSVESLAELFMCLDNQADNVNLVSPTPYAGYIADALKLYKPKTVIYNCGGYEKTETVKALDGLVDVYLPDLKYVSSSLSKRYSGAADYFCYALPALREMTAQRGKPVITDGLIRSGVIVRHLVLPSNTDDSIMVLKVFAENFNHSALFSLMAQYTPFNTESFPEIDRPLKPLEYKRVIAAMERLGITEGFCQELSSASSEYVPLFNSIVDND